MRTRSHSVRQNPLIILLSLLLAVLLLASFLVWYRTISSHATTWQFTAFSWTLVVSVFWLLITRAYRELNRLS